MDFNIKYTFKCAKNCGEKNPFVLFRKLLFALTIRKFSRELFFAFVFNFFFLCFYLVLSFSLISWVLTIFSIIFSLFFRSLFFFNQFFFLFFNLISQREIEKRQNFQRDKCYRFRNLIRFLFSSCRSRSDYSC